MKDQANDLTFAQLFPPKAATTDNTAYVSNIIDTFGYNSCTLVLDTGTEADADATFAVTMEHGNDPALADTSVPAVTDLVGTIANAGFDFSADNKCRKLGYIGVNRYLRMTVTPANNTGSVLLAGVAVLGHPKNAPTPAIPA